MRTGTCGFILFTGASPKHQEESLLSRHLDKFKREHRGSAQIPPDTHI